VSSIEEIAYQHELAPVIWSRMGDGSLKGVTYKRENLLSAQPPDFAGWHRHTLGSGRLVESICVAGNADGTLDALAMVTNDPVSNIRHVEMLTDIFDETDDIADAWFLDDAVTPTSTVSTNAPSGIPNTPGYAPYGGLTINGLWHLNGKTVQVFAGGLDCGAGERGVIGPDFTVTNGSVFVPYGDSISAGSGQGLFTAAFVATGIQIVVGFTYTSDGQIVRPSSPAESGARNGPAFGKIRRLHWFAIQCANTAGISIGTTFSKLFPVQFKSPNTQTMAPLNTFTGIYRETLQDDNSLDGMLCWRVTRPMPAIIPAIGGFLHTQDL